MVIRQFKGEDNMDDEKIIRTLRAQAWDRAKGELDAILSTFYDGYGRDDQFREMDTAIKEFVKKVEDKGMAE